MDSILNSIIAQITLPVIESTKDVFHDLMSCIIEQQIHYRSSKRIFNRALERAGITHLNLDNFSEFERISLSNLKISMIKVEAINALIEYWSANTPDFNKLSDEEVIAELSKIKGIGKWTIDMILLYTLQRPNVFPYDDFRLKNVMVEVYSLDPKVKLKAQMLNIAEQWGNEKSKAVLYLLAWKKIE